MQHYNGLLLQVGQEERNCVTPCPWVSLTRRGINDEHINPLFVQQLCQLWLAKPHIVIRRRIWDPANRDVMIQSVFAQSLSRVSRVIFFTFNRRKVKVIKESGQNARKNEG